MPIGSMGAGINPVAFEAGLAMKPDVVAIDAGSTDSGPAYLANGMCKYPRGAIKGDLEIAVVGAKKAGIPVFVGSSGTCGTDNMVDECAEIVAEIYRENGLTGKIAKLYSSQKAEVLEKKWDEGKIHALEGAPKVTRETFAECSHIVALMGAEPFIAALDGGADVVLGGRATDTANIAALPIKKGCNVAAAWHGAKTVECGSQCTDNGEAKGVLLTVDEESFTVTPLLPSGKCTPYTVAAHLVYENTDPFHLYEPSGVMMTENAVYTQLPNGEVRVTGCGFEHGEKYTMKLEGANTSGYQNTSLVGIADSDVLTDPDKWIKNLSTYMKPLLAKVCEDESRYSFNFKAYGYNAVVTGPVPKDAPPPREIGMLLTVTADTQDLANAIAKAFNPYLLHFPADFNKMLPSFAFPFSPVDCPRGATYEFRLHHIVEVDDPMELVRLEYINV